MCVSLLVGAIGPGDIHDDLLLCMFLYRGTILQLNLSNVNVNAMLLHAADQLSYDSQVEDLFSL